VLSTAEKQIEMLSKNADGGLEVTPMETGDGEQGAGGSAAP
jgi:hypothetical protein